MPWLAQGYEEQVSAYREEIAKLAPEVAVAGPDVSGSGAFLEWGTAEALSQQPALLTGHHYPLGCSSIPAPTIPGLLNPALRGREAQSLETYVGIARAQGIPLRIDEANSVSCGGVSGVSDTFGAALWATGYIGQAMAAGAVGLNMHGHPLSCSGYSELCLPNPALASDGRLRAQPDWYALLLARTLIGYRPVPTRISAAGAPNLAAAGFTGPHRTRQAAALRRRPARLGAARAADRRRCGSWAGKGAAADGRLALRGGRRSHRRARGRRRRQMARTGRRSGPGQRRLRDGEAGAVLGGARHSRAEVSNVRQKAATTPGWNCVPAHRRSSAIASSTVIASL